MSTTSSPDEASPEFQMPASELAAKAFALWADQKRVKLVMKGEDGLSAHFVATTALMRFKDDVYVQCVERGEQASSLLIYSASRVWHSDLGTNKKRVKDWLDKLQLLFNGA